MGRLDLRQSQDKGAVKQDNFSGLNNVSPAERLDPSELRKATNVDVSKQGRITRRTGFAPVYTGTNLRSLIAFGPHTLFAEADALKRWDGVAAYTWLTGLSTAHRLAHTIQDDTLYFTDNVANYFADLDGNVAELPGPEVSVAGETPLQKLPPGQLIAYSQGRLWVARDNVLWCSEPFMYGVTNPTYNYFLYNAPITVLVGLEEAVVVAADKHYVLKGSPSEDIRQTTLFNYGAPTSNVVYAEVKHLGVEGLGIGAGWLSDEGILVANAQGAIVNKTDGRVAFPEYDEASVMLREEQGARRLVAVGRSKGQAAGFAVTDDWDVEIRRNGVTV